MRQFVRCNESDDWAIPSGWLHAPSETSKGSDVMMPQPRNERASKPAMPASKRASAAGPPSLYVSSAQSKGRMREIP
jgi:hypothetical protein